MTASYLLLITSYSWCLRDLRVQCLELSVYISQYHWDKQWDKTFHFPGKFHFLVKTITDSIRLGVVYSNLVLSTARGVMFCEIYLQSAAHIITIHDLFISFIFKFFFSLILDPRFSILDLTPDFPVNLEVLLIKIVLLFDPTRFGKTRYEISILWTWSAANRVRDSQVQSYPYKHVSDTYLTSDA